MDQSRCEFEYIYAGQRQVPVVIRTPMGGKRGYGPTHSQSLEKHLLGVPDTRVLALHHRFDPAEIYFRLLSDAVPSKPTLVLENKVMYGEKASSKPRKDFAGFTAGMIFR